ncbi:uncharacterized protein LOC117651577 [Thrips palmi]|uniref:Uncharacterized protein LOC117651577 n=1 Tax=Thrips palmi TaxID=161013 RepID=A0A6P9A1E5_THRPL|nr:uncharacterized protein LOC117651577 [Thrips palmi]XP_034251603.1 uncharacterized protein LOC117651577 [Thrips palmi]
MESPPSNLVETMESPPSNLVATMESPPSSLIANEHDYTAVEVPLEAIKQELSENLDDDDDIQEILVDKSPDYVQRIPIVLRDNKPKLRVRKDTHVPRTSPSLIKPPKRSLLIPSQKKSLLLPRPVPIMPKLQFSLPVSPNSNVEPPKNCKGVMVVQDIKVCTMYVPKSEDGSATKMTLPMGAFTASPAVKSTLTPPIIFPSKQSNEVQTTSATATTTVEVNLTGNKIRNNRKSPAEPHTITAPIILANKKDATKPTYSLVEDVQVQISDRLPLCWFSAVEKDGINVMLLSFGREKAIQRRLFVSVTGNVEITVHCKPLLETFVSDILKQAGESVSLTAETVKDFSDWVLKLVHILRDFHVCIGLEWINPSQEIIEQCNVILDSNPYQESRYSETLRSKNCLKLVESGKRKCLECCKANSAASKYAKCGHKSTQTPTKKKKCNASVGPDGDDTVYLVRGKSPEHHPNSKASESSRGKKRNLVLKIKKGKVMA